MQKRASRFLIIPVLFFCFSCGTEKIKYPETKKTDHTDEYFGTKIPDPYRWLEDDNSEETKHWVENQNKITFDYLGKIPFREKIRKRLKSLWNFERQSAPYKKKNMYFFYRNDGTQNQSVFYMQEKIPGPAKALIDPNAMSTDGTVSLNQVSVSDDARYAAYGVSDAGSDWQKIFILDISSGKLLADSLLWIKFTGISWYKNGFFYSRYDAPGAGEELSGKNEFHKVYYHHLGDKQENDKLIYQNLKFPLRNYSVNVTDGKRFGILYESETTSGEGIYFINLDRGDSLFTLIAPGFRYEYQVVDNIDNHLLIKTNHGAPKYRLILVDSENPDTANWKIVVPEKPEALEDVTLCDNKIVCTYMKDASNRISVFDLTGNFISEIPMPGICAMGDFQADKDDSIAYYSCSSFTFPSTVYRFNMRTGLSDLHFEPQVDFNGKEFEVNQVFYDSKDGTKIPMFIVHKKDIHPDGSNPLLLYGYGGFNVPNLPSFKIDRIIWLECGGVFALANIRGGGEYGEEWHLAGTKLQKQNVFDDFIAAAEYLIGKKYTSPDKIAIQGRSNGGLLVGACMTQRPDLFKVALPGVGVLDMLRFHKFTIGWAWVGDYGSSDDSVQFRNLLAYSPLHNLKEGVRYPATLVTTGDHDDRVVPAHSFKFISTLQEKHSGDNPVLIRIETRAGHGAGKPVSKLIEEDTDWLAFTFYNFGESPYSGR